MLSLNGYLVVQLFSLISVNHDNKIDFLLTFRTFESELFLLNLMTMGLDSDVFTN